MQILILTTLFFIETKLVYAQELRDVLPPVDYPSFNWILVAGWGVLVIVVAVLWIWLRARSAKKLISVLSHSQQALKQMHELEQSSLVKDGKYIEFYVRLSEIIRQYIENQFSIKAPDMTTEEFLHHLQTTQKLSDKQKGFLKVFMESADMIKFAKSSPVARQMADDYEQLVKLIKDTESQSCSII